jgi:hypothetical protein
LKDTQSRLSSIGIGQWKVSDSTYHVDFENIKSEWVFIPLEDAREQSRLLSMQCTGALINEFTEMNLDILGPITGRLGRYPNDVNVGFCSWSGIIGDSNMPMEGSEWHHYLEHLPPDWQKWKQPSGLAHDAENLDWLLQTEETVKLPLGNPVRIARGMLYYQRLVDQWGIDSAWVKRYVKAEYGPDPSGEAVFKESFRPNFHTVESTELIPGYPLLIGQDFGRNPWSLIAQVDHFGRLVIHEEVAAHNIGLDKYLDEVLAPAIFRSYLGYKIAVIGDPAGLAKDSIGEESHFEVLKRHGFPAYPAPTNNIDPRIRSVEALLGRQVNGGPGLIINRTKCPILCEGMSGGYRFLKTAAGTLKPKPDKDDPKGYSHACDDLQYLSLIVHAKMMPQMVDYLWPKRKPVGQAQRFTSKAWT